jgi:hypothetical protein
MGSAEEYTRLLDEQVSYYRALAADYLNQSLALRGGDELTEALEAFRPTGSVLELACGPGVWTPSFFIMQRTSRLWMHPRKCSPSRRPRSAANGCVSFRPICSPGRLTVDMTWFSSAFGSRTYRSNALSPSLKFTLGQRGDQEDRQVEASRA